MDVARRRIVAAGLAATCCDVAGLAAWGCAFRVMAADDRAAGLRPPPGWRLAAVLDRNVYLLGTDLLNITLRFHHDGEGPAGLLLGLTGREPCDLWLQRPDGREGHWIEGIQVPAAAVRRLEVQVGRGETVTGWRLLDPVASGLSAGSWRMRARYRQNAGGASTMSREVGFDLLPTGANDPWRRPGVANTGSQRPELDLVVERPRWRPSDGPLVFHVLFREGAVPPRIGRTGLAGLTYHRLEVIGPEGMASFAVAQNEAWPRAVPPAFRLVDLTAGQRLGSCLRWNPMGLAIERSRHRLSRPTAVSESAPGPAAPRPGRYSVRAVYAVDQEDEAVSAYGVEPLTVRSNDVTVDIEQPAT